MRSAKFAAAVAAVPALIIFAAAPVAAQETPETPSDEPAPPAETPPDQHPVDVDDYYVEMPTPAPSGTELGEPQPGIMASGSCGHKGNSDRVHLSGGDASVHGWWLKTGGTCPLKAFVWVELQARRCIKILDLPGNILDVWDCFWDPISRSATRLVFAGSGSSKRVNARKACASSSPVTWRAIVDVDIPNQNDSAAKFESNPIGLNCNPRG